MGTILEVRSLSLLSIFNGISYRSPITILSTLVINSLHFPTNSVTYLPLRESNYA